MTPRERAKMLVKRLAGHSTRSTQIRENCPTCIHIAEEAITAAEDEAIARHFGETTVPLEPHKSFKVSGRGTGRKR